MIYSFYGIRRGLAGLRLMLFRPLIRRGPKERGDFIDRMNAIRIGIKFS